MSALTSSEMVSLLSRVLEQGAPAGMEVEISDAISRLTSASSAIAPKIVREFTNELGNRIKITIEGPTSTSENTLTSMEADELAKALAAAPAEAAEPVADEPKEILASRLIDAWCEDKGRKIPWAKAVQIIAIVTGQDDAERDKLLRMGDEDGSCEMCDRSDAVPKAAPPEVEPQKVNVTLAMEEAGRKAAQRPGATFAGIFEAMLDAA